jgi:hypothetical protein
MADHRRVEPRHIVGTGMATDPERIQQVPDRSDNAPPPTIAPAAATATPRPVTRVSPRAPDPRARLLHARLDAEQPSGGARAPRTPQKN